MRLIDADKLIEKVWRVPLDTREKIADLVNGMPTIRVQPTSQVTLYNCGAWYENRCECGCEVLSNMAYCPNCGAKLRWI